MQHYARWKEDLQLAADVGVNCIRYSVPWYKAEPRPGKYDWSWIDGPVEHLVTKLKIIPVMDIIHYGTPAWMEDGLADERFVDSLTAYSAAMAAHFRGLVNHYTPQNEPEINALFCAGTGRWPPYAKSPEAWSKLGVKLAKALVLQSRAIRQEVPESVLISAEPFIFGNFAREALTRNAEKPPTEQVLRDAALFPSSLALGRIPNEHPLADFLLQNGVPEADVAWFRDNFATPDIHGVNYYPEIEVAALKGDFASPQGLSLEQAARQAARYAEDRCRLAWDYYKAPIYQSRAGYGEDGVFSFGHDFRRLYDIRPHNVLAIKLSHWFTL
jgi:beta-glucosidase/6-phospho-beta-glucosidase/beta-galactosidase